MFLTMGPSPRRRSPWGKSVLDGGAPDKAEANGGEAGGQWVRWGGFLLVLFVIAAGLTIIATGPSAGSSEIQPPRTLASFERLLAEERANRNTDIQIDTASQSTTNISPEVSTVIDGGEGVTFAPGVGAAVPGCPRGDYMDASRRKRAETALAEHFERLYAKGFVAQEFDETLRGAGLMEEEIARDSSRLPDPPGQRTFAAYWDGITEDYGYSLFETPEWPKPAKCRSMWGPTNRQHRAGYKPSFQNGRAEIPSVWLESGDVEVSDSIAGRVVDRKKSWICIYQGWKQGMEFLHNAWKECGVDGWNYYQAPQIVADEEDVHSIGLARDPVSKIVSAYKEIVLRMHIQKFRKGNFIQGEMPSWHEDETSVHPGLEHTACLDWVFIGQPSDPKQMGTLEGTRAMESERFLGYLDALNCGCRYLEWQHVATSTWWMAMRRTVTASEKDRKQSKRNFYNPRFGSLMMSTVRMSAHDEIKRSGYGTPSIDEVWNTVDLSDEVPRLIENFDIPQNRSRIGSVHGGTCEHQSASTFMGTSIQKENRVKDATAGAPSDVLRSLVSEESTAQSICDSFAQDYICFGFEPPRQCSELRSSMLKYDLIVYEEGYRPKATS